MIPNEVSALVFFVNGKKIVENNADPEWTLLYYLRNKLRLCGTKLGCAEGGCGACTVMLSKYDRKEKKIYHLAVNACLAPVCSVHGFAITTVEGIGSTKTRLHPVQERIAKAHGTQCGFCTPGIVMSMYTLLRNQQKPSMNELETTFQGNLCRCTGYRPIIEGCKTFTEEWGTIQNGTTNGHAKVYTNGVANGVTNGVTNGVSNGACGMGDKCCKFQKHNDNEDESDEVLFQKSEFAPFDQSQEPIFPPELKLYDTLDKENLYFKGKKVKWYRPTDLSGLLELKALHPEAKIIVGNTEVGVEVKFKNFTYPVLLQPLQVPEMTEIKHTEQGIQIGASVTLQNLETALKESLESTPKPKTKIFSAIIKMLHWFAGKQIRNVAAIGGNIMTASPISDLNPILLACGAVLEVRSKNNSTRKIKMDEKFFTGYRKSVVKSDEVLVNILIPYTTENQYFYAYKQARRRDDDIAIVNAAFNVIFAPNSNIIKDINMAFGGMAPITVMAAKTKQNLIGLPWDQNTLEKAYSLLIEDLPLLPNAPGGMILYRKSLTLSLFFRAFLNICKELQVTLPNIKMDVKDESALNELEPGELKSSQYFQVVPSTQQKSDFVGRPTVHLSAYKHATGEAIYCDDIPFFENQLYGAFVFSTKAYANILSIDPNEALQMEGVHAFFSAKDLKEDQNVMVFNEEIFVSKTVTSQGQVLGIILADDQATAQAAAKKVKIEYEPLQPVIITIEDAIKYQSFHDEEPRKIEKGDIDKVFKEAAHVIEGSCRTGGQYHFYFETQCGVVNPKKEDNEIEIFSSSQIPTDISSIVSCALGIPQNKVITKIKRIGGGFGGKEGKSAQIAAGLAIAAHRLNRPTRMMLDRDEDMLTCGGRHPFYIKYKTAFNEEGKLLGCEIYLYANGGYSRSLTVAVLERAMFHFQNCYNIPVVRVIGYACKTNINSNAAFRAFGGPQGMFAGENIIRDVAEYLNKDPIDIARLNLYREGDITFYNTELVNCTIRRCWAECLQSANYSQRKKLIDKFNRENRWKKRGIAVTPTMYGVCFPFPFLNQAGALVLVYKDGSVLLTHAGAEMGQGLHTKMIQIASRVLEIPASKIHISETATDKVPNTSPTAGSMGSDLNGPAVMRACETIMERLKPIKKQNPKGSWDEWIAAAYFQRISLSATGFYENGNVTYNWETNSGNAFFYYTGGVACSEVEVDCLTGDHQAIRTDIVMDLGESLNPAIDIGQIEGAFMQGYGLFMTEEVLYFPDGTLFTRGPGAYKIPGFANIPREFNVSLLKEAPNPRAVYSSKAVGEPPLFLSCSILFAAKEAIKSARKDAGVKESFKLNAPATSAKLRLACEDHLTSKFEEPDPESYTPWNVVL